MKLKRSWWAGAAGLVEGREVFLKIQVRIEINDLSMNFYSPIICLNVPQIGSDLIMEI